MDKLVTKEVQRILFMIQDPTLSGLYKKAFSKSEYSILFYEKKSDWKQTLRSSHFDIVVLDFGLFPEKTIENLQEVQRLSGQAEIIVLAEQEEASTIVAAFKSGIADFYLKPTPPETISWAIEKILSRQALSAKTSGLTADMEVFNAINHIQSAKDDVHMRELGSEHLIQELEAAGAIWVWVDAGKLNHLPYTRKSPYRIEAIYCENAFAYEQLESFVKTYPAHLEESFRNNFHLDPTHWKKGSYLWIPCSNQKLGGLLIFGVNGEPGAKSQMRTEFLFRNLDASLEQYQRYKDAKEQTYLDDLTGLYNSRFLELTLSTLVTAGPNNTKPFCLLFIDIDHFKVINDKHGHVIGSQMLSHIAKTIKSILRKYDQVFRYGGDEFVAILHQITEEDAVKIANRLRAQIETRGYHFQQLELKVTLSIGVAQFSGQTKDYQSILQLADLALYESKKQGRNRVFLAKPEPKLKKTGT